MTGTVMIAFVTLVAVQSDPSGACLLGSVDRSRTPSATCLSCHDGTAAPAVALHASSGDGSHPVGVSYATARKEVSLRPQGPQDPLVVLPAGRVECVTCHTAQGSGPHRTVLSLGALCVGCHDK